MVEGCISFSDFLKPQNFDFVVMQVLEMAEMKEGDGPPLMRIPSLSLKLGSSLKKWVLILQGIALCQRDNTLLEDCKLYLQLHQSKCTCISTCVFVWLQIVVSFRVHPNTWERRSNMAQCHLQCFQFFYLLEQSHGDRQWQRNLCSIISR